MFDSNSLEALNRVFLYLMIVECTAIFAFILITSIDAKAGISAMARRRRRFGKSALTTVFYRTHF